MPGDVSFGMLGAAFLAVTGGEAHVRRHGPFRPRSRSAAWFAMVLPCLVLNYFGQGALLLSAPDALKNPFFRLCPYWAITRCSCRPTLAT